MVLLIFSVHNDFYNIYDSLKTTESINLSFKNILLTQCALLLYFFIKSL